MLEYKTIPEYLNTVAEQIRWKRARPSIKQELEHHLLDQRESFAAEGHEDAEHMAVAEMGDPVELGIMLDKIHRPKPQLGLLLMTVLLALICVFLRVWLTADWDYCHMDIDLFSTAFAFVLGCAALLGGYYLDYTRLACNANMLYTAALLIGILTLFLSPRINGASYYTRYVASCYPVIYAAWIYTCRGKGWHGLVRAIAGAIPLALVCIAAPGIWQLLLLLVAGLALFLSAARNDWFGIGSKKTLAIILLAVVSAAAVLGYVVFTSDSLLLRIETFLYPERDPLGRGYAASVTRMALTVSQLLGEGHWTTQPLPFETTVPNCDSDLLLTTLIYKLGWIPFFLFAAAFTALMIWIAARYLRQKNLFGKMVILSVILPFALRIFGSIALNLGYIWTSISFPLLMGNLQMVMDMGMLGLTLSVFRSDSIAQNDIRRPHKTLRFRMQDTGELLISYK